MFVKFIYVDVLFGNNNKIGWDRRLERSRGGRQVTEQRPAKQRPPWGTRWDLLRYLSQWWFREGNLNSEFDRVSPSNLVDLLWWGKTGLFFRVHSGVLPHVLNEYLLNIFIVCRAPIIQEICTIRRFEWWQSFILRCDWGWYPLVTCGDTNSSINKIHACVNYVILFLCHIVISINVKR